MRLSRPCYDKPHRCPGWIGGGLRLAKVERCDGGYIHTKPRHIPKRVLSDGTELGDYDTDHPGSVWWRFGRCDHCDVVTWPWFTRRLDPSYWWSELRYGLRKLGHGLRYALVAAPEYACEVLDHMPRIYKVPNKMDVDERPGWHFTWHGDWGCESCTFLTEWSITLDDRWHTGWWKEVHFGDDDGPEENDDDMYEYRGHDEVRLKWRTRWDRMGATVKRWARTWT